ncbi:MAG: cyclase family protein [Candidatus Saganbacteria bacterium]|nr:cyclase family protein [Candidatus Saganbacteria bacterium]
MYRLLSYPLNEKTPMYGDTRPVMIEPCKQISRGDDCDTAYVTFSNHSGTHIDAPKHFHAKGRSLSQFGAEEFIFERPRMMDCPKNEDKLVMPDDIKDSAGCDLLLIRTGFFKFRGSEKYRLNNPGISADAALWIREKCPGIRAVGIDTISITAFQKRPEGKRAHHTFLDPDAKTGKPVLLIEDMDLSGDLAGLKKVFTVPLYFEGVDSMPCTVIGEF